MQPITYKQTLDNLSENIVNYIHGIYFQYLADTKLSKNWVAQSVVRKYKIKFNTEHLTELIKRKQWPVRLTVKQQKEAYYSQQRSNL